MGKFPTDVTVAIIAHNARERLSNTIESLMKAKCPSSQIRIYDVASMDGTPEWQKQYYPDIHLTRFAINNGPNPARNIAIKTATTRFILLMDDDVEIEPFTVHILRSAITNDSSIAIGSPVVLYADRPDIIQYAETGLHFLCEAVNPWQGRFTIDRKTDAKDIGTASACALMVLKAAATHVGLFDERFFFGKDDGDFTHRIRLAGYKIMEIPEARVLHYKKGRGKTRYFYQIRNRWYFILKNYELSSLLFLAPPMIVHELFQMVALTLMGQGKYYLKAILGLIRMLPDIPAERSKINKYRVRRDHDLLISGPIVLPESLTANRLLRCCITLYEFILKVYWTFLKNTVWRT